MKKEEKIGLTPLNWILSILGIMVLVALIVIPPVFRVVYKEEVVEEEIPEIPVLHLSCTKKNYVYEGAYNNDTYTLNAANDRLTTYTLKKEMTYDSLTKYDEQKQLLGRLNTAYSLINGLKYSVSANDSNMKITVVEEYNMGTFKPTSITIPGDENEIRVNAPYTTSESVKEIRFDLENDGYTCKELAQ